MDQQGRDEMGAGRGIGVRDMRGWDDYRIGLVAVLFFWDDIGHGGTELFYLFMVWSDMK